MRPLASRTGKHSPQLFNVIVALVAALALGACSFNFSASAKSGADAKSKGSSSAKASGSSKTSTKASTKGSASAKSSTKASTKGSASAKSSTKASTKGSASVSAGAATSGKASGKSSTKLSASTKKKSSGNVKVVFKSKKRSSGMKASVKIKTKSKSKNKFTGGALIGGSAKVKASKSASASAKASASANANVTAKGKGKSSSSGSKSKKPSNSGSAKATNSKKNKGSGSAQASNSSRNRGSGSAKTTNQKRARPEPSPAPEPKPVKPKPVPPTIIIEPPAEPPDNVFGYEEPVNGCFEGIVYPLAPNTNKLPTAWDHLEAISVLYACEWDIPKRSWSTGFPGVSDYFEWFAIQYKGSFNVSKAGSWKFRLSSDDGTKLFIDGKLVIDNDGTHAVRVKSGSINLTAGDHDMVLEYFQGPRYHINLQLYATAPGAEEGIFSVR